MFSVVSGLGKALLKLLKVLPLSLSLTRRTAGI
jgi:hypothetical protein